MRGKRAPQSLSYPIRLPDGVRADALRLLDVSREVINATVVALWDRLDQFGERETRYAYKQVTAMMDAPAFYGDRLWRCQAEQAGRILRGQAERKKRLNCSPPTSFNTIVAIANGNIYHASFLEPL
jgi:putative transposase